MGGAQTLLTIGALILLSVSIMNMNKSLGENDITLAQSRYRLEALSLLTSRIEQASQYYFDEASTDTSSEKEVTDFSVHLGFETNDYGHIDDFDDFNGIVENDTGRSGVVYRVRYAVDYVTLSGNSVITSSARQYHKRMTIEVTDSYADPLLFRYLNGAKVRDTLKVSFIHSYWMYN